MADDPITQWLHKAVEGDPDALNELWDRYFDQLARIANQKLLPKIRRYQDGEDIALSAFHSFIEGVKKKQFPQLDNRQNLWKLLVVITARKAYAANAHAKRQRYGEGKVRGESAFLPQNPDENSPGIQAIICTDPTPACAAEIAEECERLFRILPNERYRRIAELRMQGHTVNEIADRLESTKTTVERGLRIIREIWIDDSDRMSASSRSLA